MPRVIYGTTANNRARALRRLSLYLAKTNSYRSLRRSLSANESGIYYSLSTFAVSPGRDEDVAGTTLERWSGGAGGPAGERRGRTICRTRALDAERRCPQRALCFIPGNCGPDAMHLQTATTTRPTVVDNCAIVASLLATWRLAYKSLSRKLPSAKLEGSNIEPTLLFRQLS